MIVLGDGRFTVIITVINRDCSTQWPSTCIGGSKGGAPGTRAPWRSKLFHFHAVFGKKKCLAHPHWELAPPPRKILDPPLTCASPSTSTMIAFVEMDLLLCPDSALKFFVMFYSQQTSLHVEIYLEVELQEQLL